MTDSKEDVLERAKARVGMTLRGKYRLERVLGVGGMAVVYAAKHRNNAEFAIKMLHPELSLRKELRERFVREGYIANTVKHSGAVAVSDDDIAEDGSAFIVMEMLRGSPVDSLCDRRGGRLPPEIALAIGFQLLDVLASAHANGIVHRDIKPANIFVALDGAVKVLDFGIARLRDAASSTETSTGLIMGTPAFMAPEQAQGLTNEVGPQTDVWAVGATMFSILAGEVVHRGENSQQLFLQAATTPPRPLRAVAPHVPADIAALVDTALAFQKDQRWASAAEMRDAVRGAYVAHFGALNDREALAELVRPAGAGLAPAPIAINATPTPASAPKPLSTIAGSNHIPNVGDFLAAGAHATPSTGGGTPPRSATRVDTTAQPVATHPSDGVPTTIPKNRTATVVGLGVVGVAMVALGAVGVVVIRGSQAAALAPATAAAPPIAPTTTMRTLEKGNGAPPAAPETTAVAADAMPSVASEPGTPRPNGVDEPAARHTTAGDSPARTSSPGVSPSRPGALGPARRAAQPGSVPPPSLGGSAVPPEPPPAPTPTDKPGCDRNYYLDDHGVKHFKRECFTGGPTGQ